MGPSSRTKADAQTTLVARGRSRSRGREVGEEKGSTSGGRGSARSRSRGGRERGRRDKKSTGARVRSSSRGREGGKKEASMSAYRKFMSSDSFKREIDRIKGFKCKQCEGPCGHKYPFEICCNCGGPTMGCLCRSYCSKHRTTKGSCGCYEMVLKNRDIFFKFYLPCIVMGIIIAAFTTGVFYHLLLSLLLLLLLILLLLLFFHWRHSKKISSGTALLSNIP